MDICFGGFHISESRQKTGNEITTGFPKFKLIALRCILDVRQGDILLPVLFVILFNSTCPGLLL